MKKLSISFSARIFILMMLILTLSVGLSISSYVYINKITNDSREMYSEGLISTNWIKSLQYNIRVDESLLLKNMLTTDQKLIELYNEELRKNDRSKTSLLKNYKNNELTSLEKQKIAELNQALIDYNLVRQDALELTNQNKNKEAIAYYLKNVTPKLTVVNDLLSSIVQLDSNEAKETQEESSEHAQNATWITLGISIMSFVLFIFLLIYIMRLIKNLKSTISEINRSSHTLTTSTEELTAISEQAKKAANQIARDVQEVATGASQQGQQATEGEKGTAELTIGIQRIADNSTNVADLALKASEGAKNGEQFVKKAVSQMKEINEAIEGTGKVIVVLNQRAKDIERIVNVITDIASQTNLLALNAAIEAARAGEQGKGFAVVAGEVRKLAEQSGNSAREITDLIKGIQNDSIHSVESMNKVREESHEGTKIIEQVGLVFEDILHQSENVATQIQDVSATSEEISAVSEQLNAAIGEISTISIQTARNSQNVASSTQQQLEMVEDLVKSTTSLSKMAEDLQLLIKKCAI